MRDASTVIIQLHILAHIKDDAKPILLNKQQVFMDFFFHSHFATMRQCVPFAS